MIKSGKVRPTVTQSDGMEEQIRDSIKQWTTRDWIDYGLFKYAMNNGPCHKMRNELQRNETNRGTNQGRIRHRS